MTIPEITVDELAERLEGGAVLIDVREPDEWLEARVPGVPLVPLQTIPDSLDRFPEGVDIHLICRSGGRSMAAAEFLNEQGRSCVNVAGGTMAWVESGRAVDSGPGEG